jgi:hypothetical protein
MVKSPLTKYIPQNKNQIITMECKFYFTCVEIYYYTIILDIFMCKNELKLKFQKNLQGLENIFHNYYMPHLFDL